MEDLIVSNVMLHLMESFEVDKVDPNDPLTRFHPRFYPRYMHR